MIVRKVSARGPRLPIVVEAGERAEINETTEGLATAVLLFSLTHIMARRLQKVSGIEIMMPSLDAVDGVTLRRGLHLDPASKGRLG